MNRDFINELKSLNIELTEKQKHQFEIYFNRLIEWNSKINLTSITDKEEVYFKHFYDSLCFSKAVELKNQSLLDVGSGAGFPSIPLKIVFPSIRVTIIDALQKRINFLTILTEELNIDADLIHGRIEDFDKKESFDIVTARAVASLPMLTEMCLPFVKVGGLFIPLKSVSANEELQDSDYAIKLLGGQHHENFNYEFKNNHRTLIKITKIKPSPRKYPRLFKHIKNKPLQ